MSQPIALIGPATLDMIGVTPLGFAEVMEARWPGKPVFGGEPVYQPTGLGDHMETLHLACRPHVFGGLENYEALKALCSSQTPSTFVRMLGLVGVNMGLVGIRTVSREEQKIAPGGVGWRWEFTVELLYLGQHAGGGF